MSVFVTRIGDTVAVERSTSRPRGQYASGAAAWAFSLQYFMLWAKEPESLVQLCILPVGNGRLCGAMRYQQGRSHEIRRGGLR